VRPLNRCLRRHPIYKLIISILFVGWAFDAYASEFPKRSDVYNQAGTEKIEIDCKAKSAEIIICDFNEVEIILGPSAHDPLKRKAEIQVILDQFKREGSTKTCELMKAFSNALERKEMPNRDISGVLDKEIFKNEIERMLAENTQKVTDLKRQTLAALDMCREPNLQNAEKLNDIYFRKKSKTCKVWTHQFSRQFNADGDGRWVSNHGPVGQCGEVHISVLKQDEEFSLGWNYQTQKIVTNKNAKPEHVWACGDRDESIKTYKWRSTENYVGCEYLKFR
tara:strand:+ start:25 stop:861 length:837 start_codon:yes stop_codon:yes gene_type:complete